MFHLLPRPEQLPELWRQCPAWREQWYQSEVEQPREEQMEPLELRRFLGQEREQRMPESATNWGPTSVRRASCLLPGAS